MHNASSRLHPSPNSHRNDHPEFVVDHAIYAAHITTKSEIYYLTAKPILLRLMDEIAAAHPIEQITLDAAATQTAPLR